ncbi:hypothetical protein J6590_053128 [Homalodisca vitripennis]|nr:hypothetical protein J6590_053128 [Homalodisca vitripennis]
MKERELTGQGQGLVTTCGRESSTLTHTCTVELGSSNCAHKTKTLGSALTFLTQYSDDGEDILNKIVTEHKKSKPPKSHKNRKNTINKQNAPNDARASKSHKSICPNIKLTLCSDSQGKDISRMIERQSYGRVNTFGYVRANTTLLQVLESTDIEDKMPTVVIWGMNDSLNGNMKNLYNHLEEKLKLKSKDRRIFITTIPKRYDQPLNHYVNIEINSLNNYIEELTVRMDNVFLINLNQLERGHYTKHGLHLSRTGKQKVASMIIEAISQLSWAKQITFNQDVEVMESHMNEVINQYRLNPEVAFAHCISADFNHYKQMSQGVAAVFKDNVGKPRRMDYCAQNLTCQKYNKGAAVYGLVTKPKYFLNSENYDKYMELYDGAFQQLGNDFKRRNLKTLICSPLGCVQDHVPPYHFIKNIKQFREVTDANILIVTFNETSRRKKQNGLSHSDLVKCLREMTAEPSDLPQPSVSSIPSTEPTPATDVHQPMMTPAVHLPSESTVVTSVEGGKSQYGDMSASVTGETNSEASLSSGICNDSVSKIFLDLSKKMLPAI